MADVQHTGTIERVIFNDQDFYIFSLRLSDGESVSVKVNTAISLKKGLACRCEGKLVPNHRHGGEQLQASHLMIVQPSLDSDEGIIEFIGSGVLPGISRAMARRIVERFGPRSLDLLKRGSDELLKVKYMTVKKIEAIREASEEIFEGEEVLRYLRELDVQPADATRIFRQWRGDTIRRVEANPYDLSEISGIGFIKADDVALAKGLPPDHAFRIESGLRMVLDEARSNGSTRLDRSRLVKQAHGFLLRRAPDLRYDAVIQVLDQSIERGDIRQIYSEGEDRCYSRPLYEAELDIARRFAVLCEGDVTWDSKKALNYKPDGFSPSASQVEAFKGAMTNKVMVLTGGPGSGKTTMMKTAIDAIASGGAEKILLAAPTGRAAKRLSEATGRSASTIHMMLGAKNDEGVMRFEHGIELPLTCDYLVIDEASMIDTYLMQKVLEALPPEAGLLLVGDVDQLPSVGSGQVFKDLIDSDIVPVGRLTEVHRQSAGSQIIQAARKINQGDCPALKNGADSDFFFLRCDADALQDKIVELVEKGIPERFGHKPEDIQVLSLMNTGGVGTVELNRRLQSALNAHPPTFENENEFERNGVIWRAHDRVMQTKNDYKNNIFNGDMGFIHHVDVEKKACEVWFDDKRVEVKGRSFDSLRHAWAATVHKSQGSEYKVVVLPVTRSHYTMLNKNMFYTGVTRGKELVVLVGEPDAMEIAVSHRARLERDTGLCELLQQERHYGKDEEYELQGDMMMG